MKKCEDCRYWSDRIARARGGSLEAMCLGPDALFPKRGEYTHRADRCQGWRSGHLGSIDDGGDPARYEVEARAACSQATGAAP